MTEETKKPHLMKKMLSTTLPFILPSKGKRVVFLTTLFIKISQLKEKDFDTILDAFNEKMAIVKEKGALEFPLWLGDALWKDKVLEIRVKNHQMEAKELKGLAIRIMNIIPEWSNYDEDERVIADVEQVIIEGLRYHGDLLYIEEEPIRRLRSE